jgi:fucose 4-O-acetylase-like acetyltransferase
MDYLRAFITGLVVLHHAALAYCTFGRFDPAHYLRSSWSVVDPSRWVLADVIVIFNDTFFMPLVFVVSGLFVWPSLQRKGAAGFAGDRALRLGLPFAIGASFVIPLGYYPGWLAAGGEANLAVFWRRFILTDGWPSGPLWFVWLLLAFNLATVGVCRIAPAAIPRFGSAVARIQEPPVRLLVAMSVAGAAFYLPLRLVFGAEHWISFGGPLAVMADRLGLYVVSYAFGVALGTPAGRTVLDAQRSLMRYWWLWLAIGLAIFATIQLPVLRLGRVASLPLQSWAGQVAYGVVFLGVCLLVGVGLLAAFRRSGQRRVRLADQFARDAYGIYLLHFVPVVWIQYILRQNQSLGASTKLAITLCGALIVTWVAVRLLRFLPGVARIL